MVKPLNVSRDKVSKTICKFSVVASTGSKWTNLTTHTFASGFKLCKCWELTVDLQLPLNKDPGPPGWFNLFGVQVPGANTVADVGNRLPAVWIYAYHELNGYDRNWVFFSNRMGSNNNYMFDTGDMQSTVPNNKYATTSESWVRVEHLSI